MIELFVAYNNKMMSKKNHYTLGYHGHQTLKEKKGLAQFETGNWTIITRKTLQGTCFEQGHLRLLCHLPVEQYVNFRLLNVG